MSETVYGLIEFGSESDQVPRVIVGWSRDAVDREAVDIIRNYFGSRDDDEVTEFLEEFPYPDLTDPLCITLWLADLWDFTTSPSYTRLDMEYVHILTP